VSLTSPIPSSNSGTEKLIRPRRVYVITNPVGTVGRRMPLLAIFNDVFRAHQVEYEVLITKESGDARRMAQEAVEAGADVVAACGGDGTLMEVADGLVGTGVPLAIFPAGTANIMALTLGIPTDLVEAVTLVAEGSRAVLRSVDMGEVNNRLFLLRVGGGAEAQMTLQTEREAKSRWGNLAYVLSGLNTILNPIPAQYRINVDGMRVEVEGISLMVANSGNVGMAGVNIAPGVDVSDGLLDVIVIRSGDVPSLLSVASAMFTKAEMEPEPLLHWQAREIYIETDPPIALIADGEDVGMTPVSARALPGAVQIVCPLPPIAPETLDQGEER
jgi:diacylglycerol kinase (ATP)